MADELDDAGIKTQFQKDGHRQQAVKGIIIPLHFRAKLLGNEQGHQRSRESREQGSSNTPSDGWSNVESIEQFSDHI